MSEEGVSHPSTSFHGAEKDLLRADIQTHRAKVTLELSHSLPKCSPLKV